MNKLFVATSNQNKIFEFKKIFDENKIDVELVSPKDFNDTSDPIEDGNTFEENAIIKAKFYYDKYKLPTIADDSGMCIDFFNGFPGIYSARFMNKYSYHEKNELIIKALDGIDNRKATFNCVVAYIDINGNINSFEGINEGTIAYKETGSEGFGYDPIFIIPEFNKTEAELGYAYKNKYSHRAKALNKFIEFYKNHEKS